VRWVHIPFDLEGYHYPLLNYAFQALQQGRFPEWDQSQYCGISFAGNPQTAIFYPPVWLMFVANAGRRALSYQSVQDLALAHVWLAFMLCFGWLSYRRLTGLAAALGAGTFAFSGYMLSQMQHLGIVMGYAWMPLGLWGIDEAVDRRRWRPLWKVILASAMCFLAGYTPTWAVFAFCMLAYAGWRWKTLLGTALALGCSMCVAMVQLLPALEATSLKQPELKYGAGVKDPGVYLSFLTPNFHNFGLHVPYETNAGREYLYLGAPALLGLLCLLRWRRRDIAPLLGMMAAVAVIVYNPFDLVWQAIKRFAVLTQVVRDWYFLAGLSLAAAPLAAFGLDAFLKQSGRARRRWMGWVAAGLVAAWTASVLIAGRSGTGLPWGRASMIEAGAALAVFGLGAYVLRGQRGAPGAALAAALLLTAGAEYHVYGTVRRFNAAEGIISGPVATASWVGVNSKVLTAILAHPMYRVVADRQPASYEFRLHGMRTPQGFDPFVTVPYRKLVQRVGKFTTDREMDIDCANHEGLRLLGVRYVMSNEHTAAQYRHLLSDPAFRLMEPSDSYFKIFELRDPRPTFGWTRQETGSTVRVDGWTPERRSFVVSSQNGGRFALSEQLFPGWRASVDGTPAGIERWMEAFQAIVVPPGEHRVVFEFRSPGLRAGAWISAISIVLLACGLIWSGAGNRQKQAPVASRHVHGPGVPASPGTDRAGT